MIYVLRFFVVLNLPGVLDIDIDCKNSLESKCKIYKKRNISWMLHFTGENWQFLRRDVFIW